MNVLAKILTRLYDNSLQKDKIRLLYDVNKFGEKEAIKRVKLKCNVAIMAFIMVAFIWLVAFIYFLFSKKILIMILITAVFVFVEFVIMYYSAEKIELTEWFKEKK